MATRKEAKRRSLLQFLALTVVVVIVLVAVFLGQRWWNSRPGPDPAEVTVTARVGEETTEVKPFQACELGTECPEGDVAEVPVPADGELTVSVPRSVHDHNWQLLLIYDDVAANDQRSFGPNDTDSVTVQATLPPGEGGDGEGGETSDNDTAGDDDGKRPRLMVVEVHSMMIGHDAEGNETPVATVWSIQTGR